MILECCAGLPHPLCSPFLAAIRFFDRCFYFRITNTHTHVDAHTHKQDHDDH
jgi:hypothetical protein